MGGSILKRENFLQNANTGSEVNPSSYSVGTRVLAPGYRSRVIKLTTRFCLVLRLRMSGGQTFTPPLCFRRVEIHNLTLLLFTLKYENNDLHICNCLRNA